MSDRFQLTAELRLQAPTNVKAVAAQIQKQLNGIAANINIKVPGAQQARFNAIGKAVGGATKSLDKFNQTIGLAITNVTRLRNSYTQLNSAVGLTLVNLQKMAQASNNLKSLPSNINAANKASQATQKSISSTTSSLEQFGEAAGLAFKRYAAFSLAAGGLFKLVQATRQGISEAIAFQNEVVRLGQVSGKTEKQLDGIKTQIGDLSTGFGVSSNELIGVATTLQQAGLTAEKTKIALDALAKTDLAPTFDSLADTTEGVIAILGQFANGTNSTVAEVANLEKQLGSINAVSAAYAVESSDLISVIRRAGGAFQSAGGSLEELISLFTSVRSTTRESAETIGTAFRTIITRLQRSGTVEFLKGIGIELTDLEGKFVGPFEAVKRLSEGLKDLDPRDIRFSQIVEELGGYRQISKVIPLIQEFSTSQEALGVALRGQNSLNDNVIQSQQSLAIQISKVKEEFFELFRVITDSEGFRAFLKLTLDTTSALIGLAKAAEPLIPVISAIGVVGIARFGALVGKGFGKKLFGFAGGGLVPGKGNSDTVPAMLTPGEYVLRKDAVKALGVNNLEKANRYAGGGSVKKPFNRFSTLFPDKDTREDYFAGADFGEDNTSKNMRKLALLKIGGKRFNIRSLTRDKLKQQFNADVYHLDKKTNTLYVSAEGGDIYDYNRLYKALKSGYPLNKLENEDFLYDYMRSKLKPNSPEHFAKGGKVGGLLSSFNGVFNVPFGNKKYADFSNVSYRGQKNLLKKFVTNLPNNKYDLNDTNGYIANTDYEHVNNILRNKSKKSLDNYNKIIKTGKTPDSPYEYATSRHIKTIRSLKNTIKSNKIPLNLITYRGTGKDIIAKSLGVGLDEIFDEKNIGKTFKHQGFLSSSLNTTIANDFKNRHKGLITRIFIKKGTNGIGAPSDESEVVLNYNQKLRVIGLDKNTNTIDLQAFNRGGKVDSVPALLTPGEYVMSKDAVSAIGVSNLHKMNKAKPHKFNTGGFVDGNGYKRMSIGGAINRVAGLLPQRAAIGTAGGSLFSTNVGGALNQGALYSELRDAITKQIQVLNPQLAPLKANAKSLAILQNLYKQYGTNMGIVVDKTTQQIKGLTTLQVAIDKQNQQNKSSRLGKLGARLNGLGGLGTTLGIGAGLLSSAFGDDPKTQAQVQSVGVGAFTGQVGAQIGSIFGPIGTAVGGIVGALGGYLISINSLSQQIEQNQALENLNKSAEKLENSFVEYEKAISNSNTDKINSSLKSILDDYNSLLNSSSRSADVFIEGQRSGFSSYIENTLLGSFLNGIGAINTDTQTKDRQNKIDIRSKDSALLNNSQKIINTLLVKESKQGLTDSEKQSLNSASFNAVEISAAQEAIRQKQINPSIDLIKIYNEELIKQGKALQSNTEQYRNNLKAQEENRQKQEIVIKKNRDLVQELDNLSANFDFATEQAKLDFEQRGQGPKPPIGINKAGFNLGAGDQENIFRSLGQFTNRGGSTAIAEQAKSLDILARNITRNDGGSIVDEIIKRSGNGIDALSGEVLSPQEIKDILSGPGIKGALGDNAASLIESALLDAQDKNTQITQESLLKALEPLFKSTTEGLNKQTDALNLNTEQLISLGNTYAQSLNALDQIRERGVDIAGQRTRFQQEQIAKFNGVGINSAFTIGQQQSPFLNKINNLTGGNAKSVGEIDIAGIANTIVTEQEKLNKTQPGTLEAVNLQRSIDNNKKALEALTDATEANTPILNKLSELQAAEQSIKDIRTRFAFGSNEDRRQLAIDAKLTQQARQNGIDSIPSKQRGRVLGFLQGLGPKGQEEIDRISGGGQAGGIFNELIAKLQGQQTELIKRADANFVVAQEANGHLAKIAANTADLNKQEVEFAQGRANGGLIYRNLGGSIFKPRGTDTVPAMLTPGEFVVNARATKDNLDTLRSINAGYYSDGDIVTSNRKQRLKLRDMVHYAQDSIADDNKAARSVRLAQDTKGQDKLRKSTIERTSRFERRGNAALNRVIRQIEQAKKESRLQERNPLRGLSGESRKLALFARREGLSTADAQKEVARRGGYGRARSAEQQARYDAREIKYAERRAKAQDFRNRTTFYGAPTLPSFRGYSGTADLGQRTIRSRGYGGVARFAQGGQVGGSSGGADYSAFSAAANNLANAINNNPIPSEISLNVGEIKVTLNGQNAINTLVEKFVLKETIAGLESRISSMEKKSGSGPTGNGLGEAT